MITFVYKSTTINRVFNTVEYPAFINVLKNCFGVIFHWDIPVVSLTDTKQSFLKSQWHPLFCSKCSSELSELKKQPYYPIPWSVSSPFIKKNKIKRNVFFLQSFFHQQNYEITESEAVWLLLHNLPVIYIRLWIFIHITPTVVRKAEKQSKSMQQRPSYPDLLFCSMSRGQSWTIWQKQKPCCECFDRYYDCDMIHDEWK